MLGRRPVDLMQGRLKGVDGDAGQLHQPKWVKCEWRMEKLGCGMWDVGCGMWDVGCGMGCDESKWGPYANSIVYAKFLTETAYDK